MSEDKRYASAGNPSVKAALKSLYRFATREQALERLAQLKTHFITSKAFGSAEPDSLTLWVRGYDLSEEEIQAGYVGHFVRFACAERAKKFTLTSEKLNVDLKQHPQRKQPKRRHPNWGHPILRDIKKGRLFESIEHASNELMRLHEDFPEVSIPDDARLMIILYEKVEGSSSPVQKYKFEVKALQEGGFIIDYKRNTKIGKSKKKAELPAIKPQEASAPQGEAGYFANMVKLKRKRRSPKA